MSCQKPGDQINMRQKHSNRKSKHFMKNKREVNQPSVPQPFGDTSQFNWYWRNYYSTLEWQRRHQIAYWKSRAIALEYENNILHQYLEMYACEGNQGSHFIKTGTQKMTGAKEHHSSKRDRPGKMFHGDETENINGENEFEFQITEEMMDFFEQSIRHKMELQKEREKEKKAAEKLKSDSDDGNAIQPPRKQVGLQKRRQMELMYGKAAPMIMGMETAMQLTFDRNCDLKQPKLWPNIPLKL